MSMDDEDKLHALMKILADPEASRQRLEEWMKHKADSEAARDETLKRHAEAMAARDATDVALAEAKKHNEYAADAERREEKKRRDNIVRGEQLDQREKSLDQREADLRNREQRHGELAAKHENVARHQKQELDEREAALNGRQRDLDRRESEHADRVSKLREFVG